MVYSSLDKASSYSIKFSGAQHCQTVKCSVNRMTPGPEVQYHSFANMTLTYSDWVIVIRRNVDSEVQTARDMGDYIGIGT